MNSDVRSKKKKKKKKKQKREESERERAPGIKDFLWEYMIKKIFPSISSGALVGRNSTLLARIDYPRKQHHPHSAAADGLEKTRGQRRCEHTPRRRDPEKCGRSAISVHNQFSEPVEVVGGGRLWLGWAQQVSRSEHGRGEGLVTVRVMGWGDSCPGRGGGETRELWAGREKEAYAGGGGTGPLVAPSSARFEPGGGGK